MKRESTQTNKRLFIIIGTTQGIGRAFFAHASRFNENEFIVVNRRQAHILPSVSAREVLCDLGNRLSTVVLRRIFAGMESSRYAAIYLVAIAGMLAPVGRVGSFKRDDITRSICVNFLNYCLLINEFIKRSARLSRARKRALVISSGAASSPSAGLSMYCGTKAALEMFVRAAALEERRTRRVELLAVHPGVVDTGMQKALRYASRKDFPDVSRYRALKREGALRSPEEVAKKLYILLVSSSWNETVVTL